MNREEIVDLRKQLIKNFPNDSDVALSINLLTNLLIDNPTLTHIDTISNRQCESTLVSYGHGAFGEPENDYSYHLKDKNGKKHPVGSNSYAVYCGKEILWVVNINLYQLKKDLKELLLNKLKNEQSKIEEKYK